MSSVIIEQPAALTPSWRALRYFSLYRITLAGLLVALGWTGHAPGATSGDYVFWASCFLAAAFALQFVYETLQLGFLEQVVFHVLVDVVLITRLMAVSGGAATGLGMLIGISIIWGSFLTEGRGAFPFAALASLLVLGQELHAWIHGSQVNRGFAHAGLLGAVLFAIALLSHGLARRIGASAALAEQRGNDLASLSRLNEIIVQRMRSGVLVLDRSGHIRLANRAAEALLGMEILGGRTTIDDLLPEVVKPLALWQRDVSQTTHLIRPASHNTDLVISLVDLVAERGGSVLMFLEDAAAMRQRAQQLKLASMGRLTASIAHEVRNPLGAISHASQLLAEADDLSSDNVHLLRIILDHSQRVNGVIESILRLGRGESPVPVSFPLMPWLLHFAEELCKRYELQSEQILVETDCPSIEIQIDPGHLRQVLLNLCENALRYSRGRPLLEIKTGIKSLSDRPYLDVWDHGPGIPKEIEERVFEPFVTMNSAGGTGLGLFIASELCETNQANLSLHSNSNQGCCFRISFAHPKSKQWLLQ